MSQVKNNGIQYQPPPKQPKGRKAGLRRVSNDTAKAKRIYDKFLELYFANNPKCAECDTEPERLQFHHICRGPNRKRSLTNPDTGMGGCIYCHSRWDSISVAEQLAVKFKAILRTVNRIRGRNVGMDEVIKFLT